MSLEKEIQESLPKHAKFYVKNGKHGLGCFASRFIRKGERIMVFKGPLITYAQTKTKEHKDHYFQIGPKSFQGKAPLRRRPVNHSCNPNAGIIGSETLIAIRNIKKGEEITFDYSTTMYNDSAILRCSCGSRQCRHIIKEFRYLPEKTQLKYMEIGVVPKWLRLRLKSGLRHDSL